MYSPSTLSLTSLSLDSDSLRCSLEYVSNGSLYDTHRLTVQPLTQDLHHADITYRYQYSRLLRIVVIDTTLSDGSTSLRHSLNTDYSARTGHLSRIDDFSVERGTYNYLPRVVISDGTVTITRVS